MKSYDRKSQVGLLPVLTHDSVVIGEGEKGTLLETVEDAFDMNFRFHPEKILIDDELALRTTAFSPNRLAEIGRSLQLDAVIGVYVTHHRRADRFFPYAFGLLITFVDTRDPAKRWSMYREYVSRWISADDDAEIFQDAMWNDIDNVNQVLRYGYTMLGRKAITAPLIGPDIVVNTGVAPESGISDVSRWKDDVVVVSPDADRLPMTTLVFDEALLENVVIRNVTMDQELTVFSGASEPTQFLTAYADIQLQPGENEIAVTAQGGGTEAERTIHVDRSDEARWAGAISVGAPTPHGSDKAQTAAEDISDLFERRLDLRNRFELLGDDATSKEVLRGLSVVGKRSNASRGVGIVYISAQAIAWDGEWFLRLAGDDPRYPELGLPLQLLSSSFLDRTLFLLDLCYDRPYENWSLGAISFAAYSWSRCEDEPLENGTVASAFSRVLEQEISPRAQPTIRELLRRMATQDGVTVIDSGGAFSGSSLSPKRRR